MTQTVEQLPVRRNGAIQSFDPRTTAKDSNTLKAVLESQSEKIRAVLPRHLTPEKLMRVALVSVSKNKDLQECTISSILQCVMIGAQLGLDCSGVLGSAYMVPFFNNKTGCKEAQFIPGYRGLIDLARRSGQIDDIYAHCVYADDIFELELGAEPLLKHKPNLQTERKDVDIVGAYMVAYLKGNTRPHIEFVPRIDIEKVRKSSKASGSGPWVTWFAEMCRKTAVRRGIKYLPVSVELSEALAHDEAAVETQVHSATTARRGANAMLEELEARPSTQRPLSDGQTLVDPDTGEVIQTAGEDQNDQSEQAAGASTNQESVAAQSNASSQNQSTGVSASEAFWIQVNDACNEIGLTDPAEIKRRVGNWALRVTPPVKGKEHTASDELKAGLFQAIRDKAGFFAMD